MSDVLTSSNQQVIDLRHNDLVVFQIKTDFKFDEIIILLQLHVYFDASLKKRNYLFIVENQKYIKTLKCWSWKEAIFGNKNSKNESSTTRRFFPAGFWFYSRAKHLWNGAHANANQEPTKYVSKHSTTMWPRCSISTSMAIFSRPNSGYLSSHARKRSVRVNIKIFNQ